MATSPLSLTPAGGKPITVLDVRLWHPYQGMWIADCRLDPLGITTGLPTGRVSLVVGGVTMTGTVDTQNSGAFGPTGSVRVVAGGGAWNQTVPRQDFHADNGVLSTTVYNATASLLGETVQDLAPTILGNGFARNGTSPAWHIFQDRPWWLDVTGITNVGARPTSTPDSSFVLHEFDPTQGMVSFSCDTLLLPGTTITDSRFKTPVTVYDVEQVYDARGSHGWAWTTSQPCSQFVSDLKAATLEWTRAPYLRVYRYNFVRYTGSFAGGPNRMSLQAVNPTVGIPDVLPVAPWTGLPGASAEMEQGEVLVAFTEASPSLPVIVGYSLINLPLTSTVDAQNQVNIGPSAGSVQLAGGGTAVALSSPYLDSLISAMVAAVNAASPGLPAAAALAAAIKLWATTVLPNWVPGTSTVGSSKTSSG